MSSIHDFVKRVEDAQEEEQSPTEIPLSEKPVDTKNLVENPSDEFTTQFGAILVTALILVIALAWKDFFKQIADKLFPNENVVGMFIYAIVVTTILALIIYLVARHTSKPTPTKKKK